MSEPRGLENKSRYALSIKYITKGIVNVHTWSKISHKFYSPVLISGYQTLASRTNFFSKAYFSFTWLVGGVHFSQDKLILQDQLMQQMSGSVSLEASALNRGGAQLTIFLLTDPHLLEARQWGPSGASNPDSVLVHGVGRGAQGSNDLDLRCAGC